MTDIVKKIIAALVLLCLVLIYACDVAFRHYIAEQRKASMLETTVSQMENEAMLSEVAFNDTLKLRMAEIKDLKFTNKNIEDRCGELLKASGTKVKYVDRIVEASTAVSGHDTVTCLVDSFGGLRTALRDKYAHIQVDIDSARNAIIDYTVKDSLSIICYTKRHSILFGLIKWNSYEGTKVISHNPKSTPTAVTSISPISR